MAVVETPSGATYLPCSKTREGVYPTVKGEKGSTGFDLRPPRRTFRSDFVVRLELRSESRVGGARHVNKLQNGI